MNKSVPQPLPSCPHCGRETIDTPFRCRCIGDFDWCVICKKCDKHMHFLGYVPGRPILKKKKEH